MSPRSTSCWARIPPVFAAYPRFRAPCPFRPWTPRTWDGPAAPPRPCIPCRAPADGSAAISWPGPCAPGSPARRRPPCTWTWGRTARSSSAISSAPVSAPRAADEPCPETFLIAALEANALDEITANHVRSHVLFCESCLEDFLSLRRVTREQARESIPALWIETIERIGRSLVDLAKNYGVGTILGSATIVGEDPALAVRGAASMSGYSKSIEIRS